MICSVLWAAAQVYLAIPIMLGGLATFNLLGLFNAFCISAIPLLVRPLANILQTMNGQGCVPDAECVLFPETGDLVGVSLAWKAGQLAMECNMRETTTQKLQALSISIGAIIGAFIQVERGRALLRPEGKQLYCTSTTTLTLLPAWSASKFHPHLSPSFWRRSWPR